MDAGLNDVVDKVGDTVGPLNNSSISEEVILIQSVAGNIFVNETGGCLVELKGFVARVRDKYL